MFFLLSLVNLILIILMSAKVWKQSPLLAVLGFFFWPVMCYAMIKFWGDEESDIKVLFAIFAVVSIVMFYDLKQYVEEDAEPESQSHYSIVRMA